MENQVYELQPAAVLEPHQARMNITYAAQAGDLPDPIDYDMTDAEILRIAVEALIGGVPGIRPQADANLAGFVVERYPATETRPWNQVMVRPKTEFGR